MLEMFSERKSGGKNGARKAAATTCPPPFLIGNAGGFVCPDGAHEQGVGYFSMAHGSVRDMRGRQRRRFPQRGVCRKKRDTGAKSPKKQDPILFATKKDNQ